MPETHSDARPSVSIVIPCRNEEGLIGRCLRSVAAFDYPQERLEVLVADGMSTDGTLDEIRRVAETTGLNVRVAPNPAFVVPAGLNLAIGQARGDVILRLDAHSAYPTDYVSRCVRLLGETKADNVGGRAVAVPRHGGATARTLAAVWNHGFGVGRSPFRTRRTPGEVDTVPFGCFRRELFDRLGPFDSRLHRGQDYEFNQRIRSRGGRIWYDPSLVVHYQSRSDWPSFWRYAYANGKWVPLMHVLYPYTFRLRHAVPGMFTLYLLALIALGVICAAFGAGDAWLIWLCLPLALYTLLMLAASLQTAQREGWELLPLLPAAFFTFHFLYGLGSLAGLARAVARRYPWATETAGDALPSPVKDRSA
ncbi:MAG: glycosyltransferase family 2 protein [Myxococcales bacterium]|nr:MAG: glycosyltransferase family 2 protein [Myxococcales bacterium]